MKQVLIQNGGAIIKEVPAPYIDASEILVRVRVSCLSVGTEMSGVRNSATPLWKKALQQPEKVTAAIKSLNTVGLKRTWSLIEEKRDAANPTGYSVAGTVIAVGKEIKDILPGERVSCAGALNAYHAEYIKVPRNLCVSVPAELNWEEASTVTLGAIALQGVRRANPTLGEAFVVLGLGLLGQLTVQLLKANGCRVIGVDIDSERIELAKKLGMDVGIQSGAEVELNSVAQLTDGVGADGIIITAATPSDDVISSAFKMSRKKGRVVLVGDVGLNLNRSDFYAKEIDFFISCSYGPGRYDHKYEERGLDYPLPYIRWTENRNMGEYLRLIADKKIKIDPLISARFPIDSATEAYSSLSSGTNKPMMILLTYPEDGNEIAHNVIINPDVQIVNGRIRVAVIGAGGFASSAHLPNLVSLKEHFIVYAVVTRTGHSAAAIAKQFGAVYASTDYEAVLADPNIDAVIIATRHHLHGAMALAALKAGKHVLVEKPLALSMEEVNALDAFIMDGSKSASPLLLTGYNRRFSPYFTRLAALLKARNGPFIINYRMNAGFIPQDNWVHSHEGGGRNLGEACHIYDLFTYLADSEITNVQASSIIPKSNLYGRNDNFITTLTFANGCVANLTYTALGHKAYPKEVCDIYFDGKLLVMEDFRKIKAYGSSGNFSTSIQEKGLKEELIAFFQGISTGIWPIDWWQQLQTARIGFMVEEKINPGFGNENQGYHGV